MSDTGRPASSAAQGLTEREAAERLKRDGANEIPSQQRRSAIRIVLDVLREPMFMLLAAAAAVYLFLADLVDAIVLGGFATISVSIAVIQEARSEKVLEALRDLSSPRASVIRDGQHRRIPGREVVRDDLLIIESGDRVPADAVLVSGRELLVDESLLTGESAPVRKHPTVNPAVAVPGGEDSPRIFAGTLVVGGSGRAIVTATGLASEIGKIGSSLGRIQREPPRLRVETRRLVRIAAVAGLVLSLIATVLYALFRESLFEAILAGLAVSMSMLPEEFPLVLTVFTVMGAWRIARGGVLTRQATAIETLGAATVLCSDKTGTLTQNRMSVACLHARSGPWQAGADTGAPPQDVVDALETAAMSRAPEGFDPMDRAIGSLVSERLPHIDALMAERELVQHHDVEGDLLAVVNVWRAKNGERFATTKGAPEAVAGLCQASESERAAMAKAVDEMARAGMRVLALARASLPVLEPPTVRDMPFRFQGLIGFADPLRPSVPAAVAECASAGIRVIMITGDYPATALSIAHEAGIEPGIPMIGSDIDRLDDDALRARVRSTNVFARTTPAHKLRIVNALKANGEIVGMTGDGVNDAPSLKAAHIGIAMGARGTDVAREAAAIVLLDDDFGSIVRTVRLGRRIYDNLRKAMGYIVAVHVPIAGIALLPIAFGLPLLLTPMLIAFLEMIIDPACSVVFEAEDEEDDVMRRPPRDPQGLLLPGDLITWSLIQGFLALLVVAGIVMFEFRQGLAEPELRSVALLGLVTTNIALLFANRSFRTSPKSILYARNPSLWLGLGAVAVILGLVLGLPALRSLFGLGLLHGPTLGACAVAALVLAVVVPLLKPIWRRAVAR